MQDFDSTFTCTYSQAPSILNPKADGNCLLINYTYTSKCMCKNMPTRGYFLNMNCRVIIS